MVKYNYAMSLIDLHVYDWIISLLLQPKQRALCVEATRLVPGGT